jgi:hypothetical protein
MSRAQPKLGISPAKHVLSRVEDAKAAKKIPLSSPFGKGEEGDFAGGGKVEATSLATG